MVRIHTELQLGQLEIEVHQSLWPVDDLFAIAERQNPKRAFLFVSKILGRHMPTSVAVMQKSYQTLAEQIPTDLPEPIVFIGMAETAVGLGAGVHRAYQKNRPDAVYIVTTRHAVGTDFFLTFEEEHSHASHHYIHVPSDPNLAHILRTAKSLVLVDDEASTGKTFANLLRAFREVGQHSIERVCTVTLTDWSENAIQRLVHLPVDCISLLTGRYRFLQNLNSPLPDLPSNSRDIRGGWPIAFEKDWGRLGTIEHIDTLAPVLTAQTDEKILVIGTSEFVWKPFLLAERLMNAGADVYCSATSRSPVQLGLAIQHRLHFTDNYGMNIPHYLYNVDSQNYDRIILCAETPAASLDAILLKTLHPEVICDVL